MTALALRVFPGVLASLLLAGPVFAAAPQDTTAAAASERTLDQRRATGTPRHKATQKSPAARSSLARASHSHRRRDPAAEPDSHVTAFVDDSAAVAPGRPGWSQTGVASWYGGDRWQGHVTSSGVRYEQDALTAAHATLPLGSRVRVALPHSDRAVVVTITDRPGTRVRIIDLSRGAARALGILDRGVVTLSPD
jgi:rare lipoprotein A